MINPEDEFHLRVRSQTSDGGWVIFSNGMSGQVQIEIKSGPVDHPRLDARVKADELRRVLHVIDAMTRP